ncbi:hypothetical protein CBX98_00240 [Vibrio sp. T9]|uniref:hypothetical protein n=1 Tax=Vibrio sp. T9 TaxID=2007196 RepID=UPI000D645D5D|nr:hypothetical protein [Vibrio sp. T9]PWF74122.1 hypothetical protein CBX98_00240 [Vibrio sp. T9]
MCDLNVIDEYLRNIDITRNNRWVAASMVASKIETFMLIPLQGIGKLDSKLVVADNNFLSKKELSPLFDGLDEHITLSYLWVLGAYELVRTLEQSARDGNIYLVQYKEDLKELKQMFARVRIPLAKFEAAGKHKRTDSNIAYPGYNTELGVAWQVTKETWISRRELSDGMLQLLETIRSTL